MAKLKFIYSVMNAGKSTHLLQLNYNYRVNNKKTLLLVSKLDTRSADGDKLYIRSRLGIEAEAVPVGPTIDIESLVEPDTDCVIVDEAQFLSKHHVMQLCNIVDNQGVPVVCYGLRTDAFGELFEGSEELFKHADKIEEIKQLCFCARKASHILRFDKSGDVMRHGEQVSVGAEEQYRSVCRRHWHKIKNIGDIDTKEA